jgi:Kdo2-lipid IVA lauroyltransferase/acyltransferase
VRVAPAGATGRIALSTLLLRALAALVGLLSWRRAQAVGASLGAAWFHLLRVRRRTALDNLAIALPSLAGEHARIAVESYRNLGASAFELARTRAMGRDEIAARVRPKGLERFEAALAEGRGVIVVTGHFGNFDLLAASQAARGVPLAIVSREMSARQSNRFWMETRAASGLEIFTERDAARRSLPWLRAGKVLGLVIDQRTSEKSGGVLSPFFGRRVWTSTAAARLARRTGAAIVPVRIDRREDGDHDLVVEPRLGLPPRDDPAFVEAVTAACNAVLERWIRERPGHWMWIHRRFKGAA